MANIAINLATIKTKVESKTILKELPALTQYLPAYMVNCWQAPDHFPTETRPTNRNGPLR